VGSFDLNINLSGSFEAVLTGTHKRQRYPLRMTNERLIGDKRQLETRNWGQLLT